MSALHERLHAQREAIKALAVQHGGYRALLEARWREFTRMTNGVQPRMVLVGACMWHELEMEIVKGHDWAWNYWRPMQESVEKMPGYPFAYDLKRDHLRIFRYRSLWIIGSPSQEDAIVFV